MIFCLILCVSHFTKAQNAFYISNNTIAFESPYTSSKTVGFFVRGAKITTNNSLSDEWIEVLRDYQDPIYIQNISVKKTLNANDSYDKALAPVIESDNYYGSPHLFVNVAGLKYREYPSQSTVKGILLNGTVVPTSFYSYDENEWVSLGLENGDHKGFVQQKFLGKRPTIKELKKNFENSKEIYEQKKWAERILELGWNSDKKETIEALQIYQQYAQKNETPERRTRVENQLNILKASLNIDSDKVNQMINNRVFGFTLNGIIEPKDGFSKKDLEKYLGAQVKSYTDLDDCTLGDYETNIFYKSAELVGHDVYKTNYLRKMDIINFSGFRMNDNQFDSNTTVDDFLSKSIGFISDFNPISETYFVNIPYTEGVYAFKFKNDKLWEVKIIYYC